MTHNVLQDGTPSPLWPHLPLIHYSQYIIFIFSFQPHWTPGYSFEFITHVPTLGPLHWLLLLPGTLLFQTAPKVIPCPKHSTYSPCFLQVYVHMSLSQWDVPIPSCPKLQVPPTSTSPFPFSALFFSRALVTWHGVCFNQPCDLLSLPTMGPEVLASFVNCCIAKANRNVCLRAGAQKLLSEGWQDSMWHLLLQQTQGWDRTRAGGEGEGDSRGHLPQGHGSLIHLILFLIQEQQAGSWSCC